MIKLGDCHKIHAIVRQTLDVVVACLDRLI